MAVYFITGKLGSGKTLCAVGRIRDYLEQGRRVATNLDLDLTKLLPKTSKQTVTRLPDKPRRQDMELLGSGDLTAELGGKVDENRYGAIVLDELATWFNSRNWRDKERLELIDWFLHARKYGWDVFFIVQDVDSLDAQLVNALCEHLVICKRTDRLSIPLVSSFLHVAGIEKVLPKVHVASVYYGQSKSSIRVARWWYRGKDLYSAYNTRQVFTDQLEIDRKSGEILDMRAAYSVLSPHHQHALALIEQLQARLDALRGTRQTKHTPARAGALSERFPYLRQALTPALVLAVSLFWIAARGPGDGSETEGLGGGPVSWLLGQTTLGKQAMENRDKAKQAPVKDMLAAAVSVPVPTAVAPGPALNHSDTDALAGMFTGASAHVRALVLDEYGRVLTLRVEVQQGEVLRSLHSSEIRLQGYSIFPSREGVELVKGPVRIPIPRT